MSSSIPRLLQTLLCSAAIWLAGCATTPLPPLPTGEVALPAAVNAGLGQLIATAQPGPSWLTRWQHRALNVESVLDRPSGQQTRATRDVEGLVARKLAADHPQVTISAADDVSHADWALNGALVWRHDGDQPRRATLELTLSDAKTGQVLAQTAVRVLADSVDSTPTAFFQDSPVLIPAPAAAPTAAERLGQAKVTASVNRGMATYDAGRVGEALTLFEATEKGDGADDTRVQIGLYLTNRKLNHNDQADEAFARIVAIGIAKRSLAIKFLFEPGKTEFWADPAVSGRYGAWIDQIASRAANSGVCIDVIGHSSHTGTAELNEQLSFQRAQRIGEMLTSSAPALGARLQESGHGFRENLVGTGTDDVHDALDRRVEFKFQGC
ncbi:MAG TPA: OmpA family protein [Burkholderiaceae bacterium]